MRKYIKKKRDFKIKKKDFIIFFIQLFLLFLILIPLIHDINVIRLNSFFNFSEIDTIDRNVYSNYDFSAYEQEIKKIDLKQENIYFFGGSSLVFAERNFKEVFPYMIDKIASSKYKIHNFGLSGADSNHLKLKIQKAINHSIQKPHFILIYSGHNDYSNAYFNYNRCPSPRNFLLLDKFYKILYSRYPEELIFSEEGYDLFFCFKLLQTFSYFDRIGIIDSRTEGFDNFNQKILKRYKDNIQYIINLSQKNNIPLIIVTPIGNLEEEPLGNKEVFKIFNKGMHENNYTKKINLLIKAKDLEFLTYNIRAKTPLLDFLRNIEGEYENVYVFDLENKLKSMNVFFGYNLFYDCLHFNSRGHEMVSDLIFEFLLEKKLIH